MEKVKVAIMHFGVDVEKILFEREVELVPVDEEEPDLGSTVPDELAEQWLKEAIAQLGWVNANITEPGDGVERGFASDMMATDLDSGEVVEIVFTL